MKFQATTLLPTESGSFSIRVYDNDKGEQVTAIISGDVIGKQNIPVRLHSACFTSEALGSLKCDCKHQLDYSLKYITENDGIVIYLPQEGRGIGFANKIRAYALQEKGYDTIQANEMLNLPVDCRTYEDAAYVLRELDIQSVQLLTNNPEKLSGLSDLGIPIAGRLPVLSTTNEHSEQYLKTKKESMGHLLDLGLQHSHVQTLETNPSALERPFIHVNFALDSNGLSANDNGGAIELSCADDWKRVHELREKHCAIAVGANTWINDQPLLNARSEKLGREAISQPARVVFYGKHTDQTSNPFEQRYPNYTVGLQASNHAETSHISSDNHSLTSPLKTLYKQGIRNMLVEGGKTLIASFIEQKMVDLFTIYVANDCIPSSIKTVIKAFPELASTEVKAECYGEGVLVSAKLNQLTFLEPEEYRAIK